MQGSPASGQAGSTAGATATSRRGVLLTLGALAATAVGAWAAWGDGSDPASAALRITWPDPDPRRPYQQVPPIPIVTPPGSVLINLTDTPSAFITNKNYSPAEMTMLTKAGVAQVTAVGAQDGPIVLGIWVLTVRDGVDPMSTLRQANNFYSTNGYPMTQRATLLWAWNFLVRKPGGTLNVFGAHYLRGRQLIKLEAYGTDPAAAQNAFDSLYDNQLRAWPPDSGPS
ncbi:MAG TPA: hypothetical protein VG317_18510 [Pseudonocardiaceae bacterium]|nr:hypothetical protein [Pseudonocardiaceae bacterium]